MSEFCRVMGVISISLFLLGSLGIINFKVVLKPKEIRECSSSETQTPEKPSSFSSQLGA